MEEQGTHKPLVVSSSLTLAIFLFKLGTYKTFSLGQTVLILAACALGFLDRSRPEFE